MADHYHYDYAEVHHDHRGYASDGHDHYDYAERHHRHYDDESTAEGLREDLSGAEGRISDLERELESLRGTVAANLASLNEIVTEMTAVVSQDPVFRDMVLTVLRNHTWKLGFEFQGSPAPPSRYDDEEEG
jgi:hypothetical protein